MPIVLFNERRAILRLWRRLKQLAADKRALRSFEVSTRGVCGKRAGSLCEPLPVPHVAAGTGDGAPPRDG
eukprot:661883-Prymnesium_polylepis.1